MRRVAPGDRFWAKVARRGPDECWEWTAARHAAGYGEFNIGHGRRKTGAHRMAYELSCGPIPDGLHVLHDCDNRACCNPAHLYVGTHQDNMRDRDTRGRHGNAKLTAVDVIAIRAAVARGETRRNVGKRFGIDQSQVSRIVRGQRWAHVEA